LCTVDRLKGFGKRKLKKTFGPKEEPASQCRRLHNQQLYDLCSSKNVSE
jgi:hypothetical protein